MKPIKKLFVSDMDGTFLTDKGDYDRKRLEALLDDFEREGYVFGIASGRGVLALDKLFAGLRERLVMIAENGAYVRYQGEVIYEDKMTPAELSRVVQALQANPYLTGDKFLLSGQIGAYATRKAQPAYLAHQSHYYEGLQQLDDLTKVDDIIYKLTAKFTLDTLQAAIEDFNARSTGFVAVAVGEDSVDIIRQGINKATGLTTLCQYLGVALEQVTAFGDNGNDMEFLSVAGRSLAVANAISPIKAIADQVIGHHQDSAVLTYLEQEVADIKLLALDLDGTLLTHDKQVTAENKRALQQARERGIKVVITTGRPLEAIKHLLAELDLLGSNEYSITLNGGLVQRNDGHLLAQTPMTLTDMEQVQPVLADLGLPVDVISDGVVYGIPAGNKTSLYKTANPMLHFVDISTLADLPSDRVYNKLVTVCEQDYLDQRLPRIPADLYDQFEMFKSREIIFEIMPKGVHKATGLAQLTQHLGLKPHQVLAMGDEENDLTMLDWAGWGIAMNNAVSAVKATARLTTQNTNDQSGVAEAINRYILKKER